MKRILAICIVTIASLALAASAQDTMKKTTDGKSAKSTKQAGDKTKKANAKNGGADASSGTKKNAYTPTEMTWGDAPPIIPPGAKLAVLDGNPMGDELYTIRLKFPDGYRVGPHWHPKREEVTVISGALKLGMGDKFEAAKLKSYPGGSFFYMDPDMHHYAQAKGATEIQIHGRGPVQFNYIDPKDDPSKKK
jgi:quercetin dioxygenase-like cupin family protein